MSKTPKKQSRHSLQSPAGYSTINLPQSPAAGSPQKNLTGLPRVIRDLAADIYNNIQKWNDLHIKGASLVRQIASIKAEDPRDYSKGLEDLMKDLYQIVKSLKTYKDILNAFPGQIEAVAKLQKDSTPPFISLDVDSLKNLVCDIVTAYQEEYKVKEFVLENIAHSRDKNEAMFYATVWTYQYKVTDDINLKLEALLVETGHRKINC